jgi:hypothetical protein
VIGVQVESPDAHDTWGTCPETATGVRRGLPAEVRLAKAGPQRFGGPMSGIYMILVFLAVMAALNRFEFCRFD